MDNQAPSTLLLTYFLLLMSSFACASHHNWLNHGGDIYNRRYSMHEKKINLKTISNMQLRWKFYAGYDITATPAIYHDTLYFPTWDGYLFALSASNGSIIWKINLETLTGLKPVVFGFQNVKPAVLCRSTPTVTAGNLFISIYGPAYILALRRSTGQLLWATQLETHNYSLVTMSATYYKQRLYVGTSSLEETAPAELCCTFRGSFLKLDARSGKIMWKTYMLPNNLGKRGLYAGSAIWGSSPSIDVVRSHVYIATGNLYAVPASVEACQMKANNEAVPTKESCLGPEIHGNSIVAMDINSGDIIWARLLGGYDVWLYACLNKSSSACQVGPNVDADFGASPMAISVLIDGTLTDIVIAGQKTGIVWALRRDSGQVVWSTQAGPGGLGGGTVWGSATDGRRVYTGIANSNRLNFTLLPSMTVTTAGGWVGMDASGGRVLWTTGNPANSFAPGPVTIANGILFAGSADPTGLFYAMDAATGRVMWSHETGGSVLGGASVSNGCAFVGTGKGYFGSRYTAGTTLFAFCIPNER